ILDGEAPAGWSALQLRDGGPWCAKTPLVLELEERAGRKAIGRTGVRDGRSARPRGGRQRQVQRGHPCARKAGGHAPKACTPHAGRVHAQSGRRLDMTDADLKAMIAELIRQKYAAEKGSAEYLLIKRQLVGLRGSYEMAGPIMEDLDPFGWGAMCLP